MATTATTVAAAPPKVCATKLDFVLPARLEAHQPPEFDDRTRNQVRLMVSAGSADPVDALFDDLPRFVQPGDLLVVNTSATVAASLRGTFGDGTAVQVHLSTTLPGDLWLVELRTPQGASSTPYPYDATNQRIELPEGAIVTILGAFPHSKRLYVAKLWLRVSALLHQYLVRFGQPIRYHYVPSEIPLSLYQTVFALHPGSAEMPSAGRPFTADLVTRLVAGGVGIAPLLLHTGVSSGEAHEPPYPERYEVGSATAAQINATKAAGGRVIAIGTTVVRALETTADEHGVSHPGSGWTDVVITPERGVRVVDGLLTGWHEPQASHLLMLQAIAGLDVLHMAYTQALEVGYRWHEFGDVHLILPSFTRDGVRS